MCIVKLPKKYFPFDHLIALKKAHKSYLQAFLVHIVMRLIV